MAYVPLHVHTINSPYAGMMTPLELVEAASRKNFSAVAITDQWNTYSHHEFSTLAKESGIRPVLGMEACHSSLTGREDLYHLTLLAEDDQGYENLLSLEAGHYQKKNSRYVTENELARFSGGIIALSGSINGEASQSVVHGNLGRVKKVVQRLLEIYGKNNFFIELMSHNSEREWFVCENMTELARKSGIATVVTNNDRFVSKDEFEYFAALRKMANEDERQEERKSWEDYFLKERKDLEPYFYTIERALDASGEIAERCEVKLRKNYRLDFSPSIDPADRLSEKCYRRLQLSYFNLPASELEDLKSSLTSELESARNENMSGFILFLAKFFYRCANQGIPIEIVGGNIQESFIAYLMGITLLNPLENGLVFECFCPMEDSSYPSLEFIKGTSNREAIFDTIRSIIPDCEIYFHMVREEMSFARIIREICRVLGVEKSVIKELSSALSQVKRNADLAVMLDGSKQLSAIYGGNGLVRKAFHIATHLRGRITSFNMNSARVIVLPKAAAGQIGIIAGEPEENFLMCDMNIIDECGGWSFYLHRSYILTAIVRALRTIDISEGGKGDSESALERMGDIPLDDRETYHMVSSGDTIGVYLLESQGIRDLVTKIKPEDFEQLVNAISLYRPAPLEGGLWKTYVEEENKKGMVYLPHSLLKPILDKTRGVLLYREQVRRIIETTAGLRGRDEFDVEEALIQRESTELRKARLNFIRGAIEKGIDEKGGQKVFDFLLKNVKYTHDKSLSSPRAYLSYRSAFLKAHYFRDYFAALLDVYRDSHERKKKYSEYLEEKGGSVLSADINSSYQEYIAENGDVRAPMSETKVLSREEELSIIEERDSSGIFESIEDFVERLPVISQQTILEMIDRGLFGSLGGDEGGMKDECIRIFESRKIEKKREPHPRPSANSRRKKAPGQLSLFEDDDNQPG